MAGQTITIQKGDTIYSIAKKYGISPSVLMFANNIKDSKTLQLGQKITIPIVKQSKNTTSAGLDGFYKQPAQEQKPMIKKTPTPVKKPVKNAATTPNPFAVKSLSKNKISKYTIKKGDNFEKIEKSLWLKPGQLKKANPTLNSNNLKIGQEINIPEKENYIKKVDEKDMIFNDLINKVLKDEGGINSVKGKDGKTYFVNKGITKNAYDRYLKDKAFDNKTTPVFKSTKDITENEIKELYYNYYYLSSGANNTKNKKNAYWILDTAVQCGVSEAQRLSKICKTDNDWYNERLKIYNSYVSKDSTNKKYLNGWQNRINRIKNVSIS